MNPIRLGDIDISRAVESEGPTPAGFLARYADQDLRILGTHFAAPVAGRVIGAGDSWRLKV